MSISDNIDNNFLSDDGNEDWDYNQEEVFNSLADLNYKYLKELNETPIQLVYLYKFPHIAIRVNIDDVKNEDKVMLMEITNSIREALEENQYKGTVYIEYYDSFAEIIEIDLEKI